MIPSEQELADLRKEVAQGLEREAATSEVLRIIAASPTNLYSVLDAIARTAMRLCDANDSTILRVDGDLLRYAAFQGRTERPYDDREFRRGLPLTRDLASGAAVLDRRTLHIRDFANDSSFPAGQRIAAARNQRTTLVVPLLGSNGTASGAMVMTRAEVRPFDDMQIELVKTFADQAVIAIENMRVFQELQDRNRELTELLAQQMATSEILRVIASSPSDVDNALDTIAATAARLCDADVGSVGEAHGDVLVIKNAVWVRDGVAFKKDGWQLPLDRESVSGRAVLDRVAIVIDDLQSLPPTELARSHDIFRQHAQNKTHLAVPLLADDRVLGSLSLARTEARPFTPKQVQLLETLANQAVIAIESARLFRELEERNRELTETLAQQTATTEILRVIASSPTDLSNTLRVVAESAARLCRANDADILRVEGDVLHLVASHGDMPAWGTVDVLPINHGSINGRAVLERRTLHVDDLGSAYSESEFPIAQQANQRFVFGPIRTALVAPLLRDGTPIGTIALRRTTIAPFSDREIHLLESFADQAVIAIENSRLFQELQVRTEELARSVDQLRALGEVSQVVSSTLDLITVLSTVLAQADELSGTDGGVVYEYQEASQEFHVRATRRLDAAMTAALRAAPVRLGEGAVGRAAVERQPRQIPDMRLEGAYQGRLRSVIEAAGFGAVLAVPLLREERILGGIVLVRKTVGPFPPGVIELVQTFATQSALAIQNARLFAELEAQSRELEVASRHKSEFLANMSHELRTPLNAIIGYSEMLQEEAEHLGQAALVGDLQKIHSAGRHLLGLINDILDVSKIEAGKMDVFLEVFSITDLIRDVAALVKPLADKNANALEVECGHDLGRMSADLTKVRQVLFNLLSNACKFTQHGTVRMRVTREADGAGERLRLEVADDGIGMTHEQVSRLFQAFTQADASTTRKFGGTGLGLALSRRFCQMLGGDITVESEMGSGSTFTVLLPLQPVEVPVMPAAPPVPGEACTVLVIDDDATVRDLLQRALAKEGVRVVSAATGAEGLRLARTVLPQAITLDVLMPGMDGWAVLAALKGDPELADIPVIMVSMLDEKNLGYTLGAADYMTKPVDHERLMRVLDRHLTDRGTRLSRNVLVIEDEAETRLLLKRTLESAGFEVSEADNGRSGLAQVAAKTPGLIVLDLMLPEMDGFEFVAQLSRSKNWRHIPVVVVTARDLSDDERQRLNGGVQRILYKGIHSRDDLLREVRSRLAASLRSSSTS